MIILSDTAPTQPGWYYLWDHDYDDELVAYFNASSRTWWFDDSTQYRVPAGTLFGPRIQTPEELHDLNRLAAVARYALESWGMTLDEWEATQGKEQVET